jgi:predicted esterase
MQEHALDFQFTARYFKIGAISPQTRKIWFVLHGYGQLAQYFLAKFRSLEEEGVCVIAPEGLSRFYLEDVNTRAKTGNNRVGATWMTRENRDMDIRNYLTYLRAVYQHEIRDPSMPVSIFGFSQGAATASRWALTGDVAFDELILWAGVFPPDMDFERGHDILKGKKITAVLGTTDPFVSPERMNEMQTLSDKLQVNPDIVRFEGGHELHAPTLKLLANR